MHRTLRLLSLLVASLLAVSTARANTVIVQQSNFGFTPSNVVIDVGDTVVWQWANFNHDVSEGTDGSINGNEAFTGPLNNLNPTFSWTFDAAFLAANPRPGNVYDYFCSIHFFAGMTGKVTVNVDPGSPFCFGDGSGTACPCANSSPLGAGKGCANSLGASGAGLSCTGTPSIASDTLVLRGSGIPNGPGLYFQGTTALVGGAGAAFGDGLRCVGGSVIRLGVVSATANASTYPTGTTAPNNVPVSIKGLLVAGDTRNYQLWYRDSATFCTASTFNLTNATTLVWAP